MWQDHNPKLQFQCLLNPSNIILDSRRRLISRTIQLLLACNISRMVLISIQEWRLSSNSPLKSIQFHLIKGLVLVVWLLCINVRVGYLVRAILVPPVLWDTCRLNTNNFNPRSSSTRLNNSTRPSLLAMVSLGIQVQE